MRGVASKVLEEPEETAERIGISALIIQVYRENTNMIDLISVTFTLCADVYQMCLSGLQRAADV